MTDKMFLERGFHEVPQLLDVRLNGRPARLVRKLNRLRCL